MFIKQKHFVSIRHTGVIGAKHCSDIVCRIWKGVCSKKHPSNYYNKNGVNK